jgi:hypothetical protein
MARSFERCLQALTTTHGISEQEALDILQQVSDRADELRRGGTPDAEMAAAGKLADEFRAKATSNRIAAINSVLRRVSHADDLAGAEQRLAAVSATPFKEHPRVEVPYRWSGGPTGVMGAAREIRAGWIAGKKLVMEPFEPFKAPPRPATFPEGAPSGIRMENLHPEDQEEIARANDAIVQANDMRAGYEAAAQCLTGAGLS